MTDGELVFASELGLQTVLGRIKEENDSVVGSGAAFVSIGYVVPLPHDPKNGLLTALRHELDGAYLAQWRANHTPELGDAPRTRLLIVNVGDQAGQWGTVIPEVIRRSADPAEHLVAVAGLGQSLDTTKHAIQALSEAGIPMIASRLTADDLSTTPGQPVPGLFRISPTNSMETTVAARVLKSAVTLLVQDRNQGDAYTNSLATRFRTVFTTPPTAGKFLEPESYDSSKDDVDRRFQEIASDICYSKPTAIYYAGRGVNLPGFLAALAQRRCRELKIDLFTGDDAVDLTALLRQQLAAGYRNGIAAYLGPDTNITFHFTGLAHPGEWSDPQRFQPLATNVFQQDCTAPACFTHLFPDEQLDDGAAIVGYDALLVAVRAIRSGDATPSPSSVLQHMYAINEIAPVYGASGPIGFDEQGKPVDKPIPILQLNSDGTVIFTRLG